MNRQEVTARGGDVVQRVVDDPGGSWTGVVGGRSSSSSSRSSHW